MFWHVNDIKRDSTDIGMKIAIRFIVPSAFRYA